MQMNLANKLTMMRVVLIPVFLIVLLSPLVAEPFSRYIAVAIFVVASITDFLDGYIARSRNLVTDFGKMIDAIADKMLVNSVLIILAASGFIHPIIPVIIVMRDSVVNSIKMIAGSKGKVVAAIKSGNLKTACLMTGIALTLFYNLPFELINIRVSDFLLFIAAILSLISCGQYYLMNKDLLFEES